MKHQRQTVAKVLLSGAIMMSLGLSALVGLSGEAVIQADANRWIVDCSREGR